MIRIYEHPKYKPSQHDVALLERHVGTKLPSDYRDFLLENNGGYVVPADESQEYNLFRCSSPASGEFLESDPLALFYSLQPPGVALEGPFESVQEVYDRTTDPTLLNLPKNVLVIGETINAYRICMFLDSQKRGNIFLVIEDMQTEIGSRRIAASFSQFVSEVYQRIGS